MNICLIIVRSEKDKKDRIGKIKTKNVKEGIKKND